MVKVFYLLHVVWCDGLCVGFRLPLQIASSYRTHKAANGIQRDCGKLAVADTIMINTIDNYKLTNTSDGKLKKIK